jgi:uncharacterized membrane protein YphA (DoxX/SURF4 family)
MRGALSVLVRVGLGLLLAVAGALKLRDPSGFATEIANYQLFPGMAPYLAAVLPAVELILGIALIVLPDLWRRAAAAGAVGLFVAFSVAVGSAYFRRINISCGCFGGGGDPITGLTLIRNLLLSAAAVLLVVERQRDSQNFTFAKNGRKGGGPS